MMEEAQIFYVSSRNTTDVCMVSCLAQETKKTQWFQCPSTKSSLLAPTHPTQLTVIIISQQHANQSQRALSCYTARCHHLQYPAQPTNQQPGILPQLAHSYANTTQ